MIPAAMKIKLTPVLGEDIARSLCAICETHKAGVGGSVSVPSWVLVVIAEKFVEALEAR